MVSVDRFDQLACEYLNETCRYVPADVVRLRELLRRVRREAIEDAAKVCAGAADVMALTGPLAYAGAKECEKRIRALLSSDGGTGR